METIEKPVTVHAEVIDGKTVIVCDDLPLLRLGRDEGMNLADQMIMCCDTLPRAE